MDFTISKIDCIRFHVFIYLFYYFFYYSGLCHTLKWNSHGFRFHVFILNIQNMFFKRDFIGKVNRKEMSWKYKHSGWKVKGEIDSTLILLLLPYFPIDITVSALRIWNKSHHIRKYLWLLPTASRQSRNEFPYLLYHEQEIADG